MAAGRGGDGGADSVLLTARVGVGPALWGSSVGAHVQDFELEAALELGILQRSWVRRMF